MSKPDVSETDVMPFVYEPDEQRRRRGWCEFRVWRRDFGLGNCTRYAVERVGGYGFCRQHAEIVRRKLGMEEA